MPKREPDISDIEKVAQSRSLAEAHQHEAEMRRELNLTRAELKTAQSQVSQLEKSLVIVKQIEGQIPSPPKWLAPPPSKKHRGTPLLVMADNHFDEVVNPDEIMGLNRYNREIAMQRLRRTFEGAITLPQEYIGTSLQRDGIMVAHAGDLITGEIHDELTETNEAKPTETLDAFVEPMIAVFDMLLAEYKRVHVVAVSGNHDRLYRKYRHKGQARTSWAWLFWKVLVRHYQNDPRITFTIPDGPDTIFSIYDTRILLHHGEQFRGGSGIAGPLTPIALGQKRKALKHMAAASYTGREDLGFDVMIQGHIHHRNSIPNLITVGAAKGFDEFANSNNFPFEPASQELLIVTPERGITFQAPIYVQNRKEEKW